MLTQLAAVERYAPLVAYVVQSLQAGGDLATAFLEQMIDDAQVYLADAVAAGVVRPSRDPRARARYLVMAGVGMLLVHLRLHPVSGDDLGASMRELSGMVTLPALELYSEVLFTDRSMLDGYLMYVPDPPAARAEQVLRLRRRHRPARPDRPDRRRRRLPRPQRGGQVHRDPGAARPAARRRGHRDPARQ